MTQHPAPPGLLATLKQTPLHHWHQEAGAKLTNFSGWEMPLQYNRVTVEHLAVRTAAGLFDVSHMGIVCVASGNIENTRAFLNYLVPQNLDKLTPGKAVYTQFLNKAGGILDDIIIYQLPNTPSFNNFKEFLIIMNAGNTNADLDWLHTHTTTYSKQHPETPIHIANHSNNYGLLALQGPKALRILDKLKENPQHETPKRFHLNETTLRTNTGRNIPTLICRTGYTGEDGVELIVANADLRLIWESLLSAGEPEGIQPIGLSARDTLRTEAAYPLHGQDITPNTTPIEAGLRWSVKLKQPHDFIGKSALLNETLTGSTRQFYCFKPLKKTIARPGDLIYQDNTKIGHITSGSIAATLSTPAGEPIAMGYIDASVAVDSGDTIQIEIRGKRIDARIVDRPFYTRTP